MILWRVKTLVKVLGPRGEGSWPFPWLMHLIMSSRCGGGGGGEQGIGRDFDRSLWPGGRAFELSCYPGGRDI